MEKEHELGIETGVASVFFTPSAMQYYTDRYGYLGNVRTVVPVISSVRNDPLMEHSNDGREFYVDMRFPVRNIRFIGEAKDVFTKHHYPPTGLNKYNAILDAAEDPYFKVVRNGRFVEIMLSARYHTRKDMKGEIDISDDGMNVGELTSGMTIRDLSDLLSAPPK